MQNTTSLMWYMCPKCGGKHLAIREDTEVRNLPRKCKHCKKISLISLVTFRAEK